MTEQKRKDTLPANLAMTNEDVFITYLNRSNKARAFHYYRDSNLNPGEKDNYNAILERSKKQNEVNKRRNMSRNIRSEYQKAVLHIANECIHAEKNEDSIVRLTYIRNSPLNDWRQEAKRIAVTHFIFMTVFHAVIFYIMHFQSIQTKGLILFANFIFWLFYFICYFIAYTKERLGGCDFRKIREEYYDFEMQRMEKGVQYDLYRKLHWKFMKWPIRTFFICHLAFLAFAVALS